MDRAVPLISSRRPLWTRTRSASGNTTVNHQPGPSSRGDQCLCTGLMTSTRPPVAHMNHRGSGLIIRLHLDNGPVSTLLSRCNLKPLRCSHTCRPSESTSLPTRCQASASFPQTPGWAPSPSTTSSWLPWTSSACFDHLSSHLLL